MSVCVRPVRAERKLLLGGAGRLVYMVEHNDNHSTMRLSGWKPKLPPMPVLRCSRFRVSCDRAARTAPSAAAAGSVGGNHGAGIGTGLQPDKDGRCSGRGLNDNLLCLTMLVNTSVPENP